MKGAALAVVFFVGGLSSRALAGPFTREAGSVYLGAGYYHVADSRLFAPNFSVIDSVPYQQHVLSLRAEVGVASWLTAVVDGSALRYSSLQDQGSTIGVGDWRFGALVPLLKKPFLVTMSMLVGVPLGDPSPSAGKDATPDQQAVARSLPTGDGEWDLELRLCLGYSFGGVRRWPLYHYVIAEAGYWVRSAFYNSFVWRVEVGARLPYRVVDHLWFIWRFTGVESSASDKQAAANATGLGDGVTYDAGGAAIVARLWRGLGAWISYDLPLRGRSLSAGGQLGVGLSYER